MCSGNFYALADTCTHKGGPLSVRTRGHTVPRREVQHPNGIAPEIVDILDTTDHASGTKSFYQHAGVVR
jgi:hypothetical protein